MDLNLLKIFVSVAEKKSITKAAKKLNFAQSNVTSRIKQLEKELTCKLFFRVSSGVILTKEGERFYPHAKELIRKMEIAINEVKGDEINTHLRIGSSESNAVSKINSFLLKLHKDFPKMQIELITDTTKGILELLKEYKIDIAFISGKADDNEFSLLNEIKETLVLVEAKGEASQNVYLSFKDGCAYTNIGKIYFSEYLQTKKRLEFGNFETILGCVRARMGKSILPLSIVNKLGYDKKLKITHLPQKFAHTPTSLIRKKDVVLGVEEYLKNFDF